MNVILSLFSFQSYFHFYNNHSELMHDFVMHVSLDRVSAQNHVISFELIGIKFDWIIYFIRSPSAIQSFVIISSANRYSSVRCKNSRWFGVLGNKHIESISPRNYLWFLLSSFSNLIIFRCHDAALLCWALSTAIGNQILVFRKIQQLLWK